MAGDWQAGECANCGAGLDLNAPAALFCGFACRSEAKDVRYFRRCHRDGRTDDPDVWGALRIRLALRVSGGYDAPGRWVDPDVRRQVLAGNSGLCRACGTAPATELDHVDGPSGDPSNLQGLCDRCHNAKTRERIRPTDDPAVLQVRDDFLALVRAVVPVRACHDDVSWDAAWPGLLKETRQWRGAVADDEAGYWGDGSTGTREDYEHGWYLQDLAERDERADRPRERRAEPATSDPPPPGCDAR